MTRNDDETTQRIIGALKSPAVWDRQPEIAGNGGGGAVKSRLAELATFRQRMEREDADATTLCNEILTGPAQWWPTRLRQASNFRTAGTVRQLLDRVRPMLDGGNPPNALQVANMAVEIANDLGIAEYPSDTVVTLRAQALRDQAYVLAYMGRYPEALPIAERARTLLQQTPLPDFEIARVDLVRAFILRFLERHEEAIALSRQAAETFRQFGERKRYVDARVTEAAMVYAAGDKRAARDLWKSLEADSALDVATHARVMHNIGVCSVDLGELLEAAGYLQKAAAEYEFLGIEVARTRTRWAQASVTYAAGRAMDSIPLFRQAWREFEGLEMEADAAIVALELAEAFLTTGQPEQVPAICRTLLERFTRAGMTTPAVTALAFLREAIAIGQATPTLVRHVHDFLRELPSEPRRLFAPPLASDTTL